MTAVRHLVVVGAIAPCLLGLPSAASAAPGWQWPLPAPHQVVEGFAPPPARWMPGQRGVVLAGRAGEPVRAAGAGVVGFAGRVGGVGVVTVRHANGLETTYEPVRASVRTGAAVAAGDVLGRLSRRGSECAPAACLHWGLRRGIDYLDPLALVGADEVRLLPLGLPRTSMRGAVTGAAAVALALPSVATFWVTAPWAIRRAGRRSRRGSPASRQRRRLRAGAGG